MPFAVEQPEPRFGRELGAQRVAKRRVSEHLSQRNPFQTQRRLPALQAFHRIRRFDREVHRQRAARNLTDEPVSPHVGLRDRIQIVEHGFRVGAVVQQGGDHDRPAACLCERFEKGHAGVAALGEHGDAAARFAHGVDQRRHFAVFRQT